MTDPEFDADGYPTEETLQAIRDWKIEHGNEEEVLRFVQRAWRWESYFTRAPRRSRAYKNGSLRRLWYVSTGGWSGNEDLIRALEDNFMFWVLCWVSSRRGGHYEFETR